VCAGCLQIFDIRVRVVRSLRFLWCVMNAVAAGGRTVFVSVSDALLSVCCDVHVADAVACVVDAACE